MPPSRRDIVAGLTMAATSGLATKARTQPAPKLARIIDDPRASSFDIGPDGNAWRVLVGLPDVPAPPEGYSAIIATDGNASFPGLWDGLQALAPDAPVVLIGVGYPTDYTIDTERRWFDLTSPGQPPQSMTERMMNKGQDRKTGGRRAFLDMIADSILPAVNQRVRLNMRDLTLYGHSLGGLFTLHALFTRPEVFARYVASDPSVWWNNGEALREAAAFAGGTRAAGGSLSPPLRLLIARSAALSPDNRLQSVPALVEILRDIDGLEVIYQPYPDETHGSLAGVMRDQVLLLHLGRLAG
ncbi:alpha/beta hydrolase [Paracoccus sp. 11-3]|uniref:Alpha/beta hydrolase n=1 Tax=Paracoccus amoyensis TaxID=2760093 RepID=A0A926G903_9RHOB|nr:alpha/beta hydrolase-fold protein [Paracoccus amoyensis]MBC9245511.1 alpha/beta hydrolase [Paracoccus amoyensis]